MENVTTIKSAVKSTLDDVHHWARSMGERGVFTKSTAQSNSSALRQLSGVLADDERQDPISVLQAVEELGARWARLNNARPATVGKYIRRSRHLLNSFISYHENPETFKAASAKTAKPVKASASKAKKKPKKTDKSGDKSIVVVPGGDGDGGTDAQSGERHRGRFPLKDGRVIEYVIPDDLAKDELARFGLHLATLLKDVSVEDLRSFVIRD